MTAGGGTGGPHAPAPPGWTLEVHSCLPSSSDALRVRAEAGAPARLALLALRQTAGRGRAGRSWSSPVGNLHLSALLRPATPLSAIGQWSLLAGVALAEAARDEDPDPAGLRLKWPNDLLRHGAKVAGILVEAAQAEGPGAAPAWVVIGIGANLAVAPPLPDRPTATLASAPPPRVFAARLLARLDHWAAVEAREGFGPVRSAWMALGPDGGSPLTLRHGNAVLAGRFAGLAEDGGLLLDTPGGRRHIVAGEVLDQPLAATGAGPAAMPGPDRPVDALGGK